MNHEDHIQHLVAEVQDELPEVAVAVDGGVDVAPAVVPNDDAIAEVCVDVLEDFVFLGALFVSGRHHLADPLFKLHRFRLADVYLLIRAPYLWHTVVGYCQRPLVDRFNDLLAEGAFAGAISANYDCYLSVSVFHNSGNL